MDFYAYFWNNEVYIQEKYRFNSNEILTKYLNTNYLKKIEEHIDRIVELAASCNLTNEEILSMVRFSMEERL